MSKIRLGILLSGRGSNFLAIADAIANGILPMCEIVIVLSNKTEARGLDIARERGLNAVGIPPKGMGREEHDRVLMQTLKEAKVDLICLAGYLRLLSPAFIQAFENKILNIHPSLLPAFPGLDAQEQAFEAGAKIAGCTVHFVEEKMDAGVIIVQRSVEVQDDDNALSLAGRILHEEHVAYPEAILRVISGDYEMHGRRYVSRTNTLD